MAESRYKVEEQLLDQIKAVAHDQRGANVSVDLRLDSGKTPTTVRSRAVCDFWNTRRGLLRPVLERSRSTAMMRCCGFSGWSINEASSSCGTSR